MEQHTAVLDTAHRKNASAWSEKESGVARAAELEAIDKRINQYGFALSPFINHLVSIIYTSPLTQKR
jgi:hypothetical protein